MTSELAQVHRFSGIAQPQILLKFWSSVQNFSAAQWPKFGDTGRQIFTTGQ